ncbi:MAG: peptidoglycan DD-metalloendopeptidase family protein [Gloeobacterales cyanobacterium]
MRFSPKLVALGLLACFLLEGFPAIETVQGQTPAIIALRNKQSALNNKLEVTRQKKLAIVRKESFAKGHLNTLKNSVNTAGVQLDNTQKRLAESQQKLKRLGNELKDLEQDFTTRKAATMQRMRYLQQQGSEPWWSTMLASTDMNDAFDRQYHLTRIVERDRAALLDLKKRAEVISSKKDDMEDQKAQIALLAEQLADKHSEFKQAAAMQVSFVQRVSQERRAYEAAERELERNTSELTGLIRNLIIQRQKELERKRRLALEAQKRAAREAAKQAANNKQPVSALAPEPEVAVTDTVGTGRFIAPGGGRITSRFGYRIHPIYGTRRFHAGVDFGLPIGAAIRAADSGVVIYSGWYGGYGRTVIIDHGNGLTTLYGHTSASYVSAGQSIQRGQRIAAVGSTGLSTGPHLHFEVRVNGTPVNPLNYLH